MSKKPVLQLQTRKAAISNQILPLKLPISFYSI